MQDPPEYFRPLGGLLTFDIHLGDLVEQAAPHQHALQNSQAVPMQPTLKLDADKMGHFNLVNAQIQQVQSYCRLCICPTFSESINYLVSQSSKQASKQALSLAFDPLAMKVHRPEVKHHQLP